MDRIFINLYDFSNDWIMGKIADDIQRISTQLGFECRCGKFEDYNGEEICYHLEYHRAVPIPKAKHNSVFYTHLNDILQEVNLVRMKDSFDSFICMSSEDAQFLIELGFDKNKVFGMTLPIRNNYIKPISIGIFSACYPDGRKNESWLINYCKQCEGVKYVNFVFIGKGWGNVAKELEALGCSYEWHNVSRQLPYEYQFQQNKLSSLNYYIYMGMDGGAMGTYDAYAQDVPLCVTYDGFHKSIPYIDLCFDNEKSFYSQLDIIISRHANRLLFFRQHTVEKYVDWLLKVWQGDGKSTISDRDRNCLNYTTVLEKKREQYYKINLGRLKTYIKRVVYKVLTRKKIDNSMAVGTKCRQGVAPNG